MPITATIFSFLIIWWKFCLSLYHKKRKKKQPGPARLLDRSTKLHLRCSLPGDSGILVVLPHGGAALDSRMQNVVEIEGDKTGADQSPVNLKLQLKNVNIIKPTFSLIVTSKKFDVFNKHPYYLIHLLFASSFVWCRYIDHPAAAA